MYARTRLKTTDIAYISLMAALIAICAWISIPTAVPFTMQTFGVFVAAGLLGPKRSSISILVYMLLGAVGLPVFSNFTGGIGILLGKTGGYIVGFIFLALIEGWTARRYKGSMKALFLSMVVGIMICYAFGSAWFIMVYAASSGAVGLMTVLGWCVFPFIIPDLAKMALALIVIRRVSPLLKLN
ncbi:MAG: biotin transporter BioY [Oscillospiraceae bacterium]